MRRLLLIAIIIGITSCLLWTTNAGAATIDPGFSFMTKETGHFHIHYHQGLEETALKAASIAERSHSLLTAALGWAPKEKTHIVLVDSSDMANGFATVLPYNLIYVYTVPPAPDMSIGQYENWLGMVITHEYAHVLSMDTTRGHSSLFRSVFGKPLPGPDIVSFLTFLITAPPNVLLPNWWLEGMSVWAETEFAGTGRGNSTFYEMYFRSAVAENNLPDIDMINGDPPDWPARSRPYIYGLALIRHITKEYGADSLKQLNTGHAGRFPYFISAPAKRSTGKRYSSLFSEAMHELKREQEIKIQTITQAGLTVPALFPAIGESMTNPVPSPDESLLAVSTSDPHRHDTIAILDSASGEVRHEIRVRPSDSRTAWGPEGRYIYFTEADLDGGYNLYMDLYAYNLKKGKKRRLTKGQRVKEPAVSRDGRIAVISIGPESQSLAVLANGEPDTGVKVTILKEFRGSRLSHPSWCPDAKHIVFAARDDSGKSRVIAYNVRDGSLMTLMESTHYMEYPTYTPDGNRIIYVSDETGVFNIYEYNILSKRSRRLSNLIGGALNPAVDSEGMRIYFSSYTSYGYRAGYIMYPESSSSEASAPVIRSPWPERGFTNTPTAVNDIRLKDDSVETSADRHYNALWSALPRFWLPSIWADHDGVGPGVFTAGEDALAYHAYMFSAGIGGSGRGYYYMGYLYDRHYPSFYLWASRMPAVYTDFFNSTSGNIGPDLYDQEESFSASVELPLRRLEWGASLEAGYEYKMHKTLESQQPVFEGRRDNVFAILKFSNTRGYLYSISREEGRNISLQVRDYSKKRNSDVESREYTALYEEFLGLGGHRVLYFKLAGGASKGEKIPQQAFRIGGTSMENQYYPLRGYPAGYRTGEYVAFSTVELRLPLLNIQRGRGTFPLFARQLHMALFADAAAVWNEGESLNQEIADPSAGVELRLDITLGYKIRVTPTIGYAHGFSKDSGEDVVYLVLQAML